MKFQNSGIYPAERIIDLGQGKKILAFFAMMF